MNLKNRFKEFRISAGPVFDELKFILHRIKESPLSIVGAAIIVFYLAVALLAPVLAPPLTGRDPYTILHYGERYGSPDYTIDPRVPQPGYPFGTTEGQYDLYYGCVWGARVAFRIGIEVVGLCLVIGIIIGTISGYYGSVIDELMMRFTDIVLAFPGLLLAMALVLSLPRELSILGVFTVSLTSLDKVLIALILVSWPSYARVIRSEILRIRTEDYVEAAKSAGCSDFRILTRHVIPNAIYPIVIMASLDTGAVVLTAAAMGFLGLGAPAGYADWGQLVALSRNWILGTLDNPMLYWHVYIIPGLFIFIFVLGWNLIGDAFRDVLDPMIRRK